MSRSITIAAPDIDELCAALSATGPSKAVCKVYQLDGILLGDVRDIFGCVSDGAEIPETFIASFDYFARRRNNFVRKANGGKDNGNKL